MPTKHCKDVPIEIGIGRYLFQGKARKNADIPTKIVFSLSAVKRLDSKEPIVFTVMEPERLFTAIIRRDGSNVIWFKPEKLSLEEATNILEALWGYAGINMEMI